MIELVPHTITRPLNQGYFPDQRKVTELVEDMRKYIITEYKYGELYEFSSITMGYQKCQGYGEHEACDDVAPMFGNIVFKIKDKK